jgi:hypothetical protein
LFGIKEDERIIVCIKLERNGEGNVSPVYFDILYWQSVGKIDANRRRPQDILFLLHIQVMYFQNIEFTLWPLYLHWSIIRYGVRLLRDWVGSYVGHSAHVMTELY